MAHVPEDVFIDNGTGQQIKVTGGIGASLVEGGFITLNDVEFKIERTEIKIVGNGVKSMINEITLARVI